MKKLALLSLVALATATVWAAPDFPKADFPNADFPTTDFPSADFPSASLETQLQTAATAQTQPKQAVSIPGAKRLVSVRLELSEFDSDSYTFHRYWRCPAVIFNAQGALAFDGECWTAFTEAAKLPIGPMVHFLVSLDNFGEYTYGENQGRPFYFESVYMAEGPSDEEAYNIADSFKRSADKSYIIFKRSLFNDPKNANNPDNSEVKQAIAKYYKDNNLKEVNAETLSAYFKAKHPTTKEELHPIH